jgi:hypothetical protein
MSTYGANRRSFSFTEPGDTAGIGGIALELDFGMYTFCGFHPGLFSFRRFFRISS